MNIGVDSRSLSPMKTGVGTYVSEVLSHWPARQPPDCFTLFSHQPVVYPETDTIHHEVVPSRWGLPWYLLQSHRAICRASVHVFWATQGLLPLGLPRHVPAVITIHDCIHHKGIRFAPSLLYNLAHRSLLPLAVKRAGRILVVSRFVATEVMHHFGVQPSKIEVTPLGVRPEFFELAKAAKDGNGGLQNQSDELNRVRIEALQKYRITPPFILGVGTLEPRKNLRTLLEAFARLPSRLQRQFQLVLVGKPGWGTTKLNAYLQSYPLRSRLVLTGYVPQGDLRLIYGSAGMFVFPSFYEGFGLPVADALASGCPVVASTAAALKEIAGSAAIFVDPDSSAEEWSRAIARVAESAELRRSLAAAGHEQARKFSWEICAQRTCEVVKSVAEGKA